MFLLHTDTLIKSKNKRRGEALLFYAQSLVYFLLSNSKIKSVFSLNYKYSNQKKKKGFCANFFCINNNF